MSLGTILIIILLLMLLGVLPTWPHSRSWGYCLRNSRIAAMVLAMAALGSWGCSSRIHTPFRQNVVSPRLVPAALHVGEFDYRRGAIHPEIKHESETEHYWVRSISLPSIGENGQQGNLVTARYYQGKGPGPRPLIFVLPVWGISTYPPNAISKDLRRRAAGSIDVLQMLGEDTLFDWDAMAAAKSEAEFLGLLDRMVDRSISTVIDIRRLVDWAERQPDVDSQRIALIGFSMSALVASIVVAEERRFGAGILIMGGAELHEAFATCGGRMRRVRETLTRRFGWTVDQLRRKVERPLARVNPTRAASLIDPSRILVIEAAYDSCLLRAGRDRLWHAMGRPERIAYLYGHNMAFLAMTILGGNNIQRQVYRFLRQTILPDVPEAQYEADRQREGRLDPPRQLTAATGVWLDCRRNCRFRLR